MIKAAKQIYLLADSSKWNQTGFIKVASLERIDTLITDGNLPRAARAAIKKLGIELLVV